MGVRLDGDTESPGQAKIRELQVGVVAVDQKVLGLEVSVQDPPAVAVCDSANHLVNVQLHGKTSGVGGFRCRNHLSQRRFRASGKCRKRQAAQQTTSMKLPG